MAMLFRQLIRRSAFSRRGTAAALTPSAPAFSRFCSISNWVPGPQNESAGALGKLATNYLFPCAFTYTSLYCLDYSLDYGDRSGRRKELEELEKLYAEQKKERLAYDEVQKELNKLRKELEEMEKLYAEQKKESSRE